MNAIRSWIRAALFAGGILAAVTVTVAPATSQGRLDADTFKAYGGTFNSDCRNLSAPRVTLFEDAIVFLQGSRRIAGANLQPAASFFGNLPPDGYRMTFLSETPDGKQLILILFEDESGRYATVDGDQGLIDASIAGKMKFRDCSAAKPKTGNAGNAGKADNAADVAKLKDEEISGSGMIELRPKFKAAYLKALGPRAKTEWLATLDGPSSENRRVQVAGQPYLLVSACKAHDCGDHNVVILWSAARNVLYGMIHEAGKSTHIGKPSPAVAKELGALWRAEFRRQP